MIAFPGFGQQSVVYKNLARALPDYRIFGISMPFHGQTKIKQPGFVLLPEDVSEMMEVLVRQEKIKNFSLVGFSIGVRLIMPVLQNSEKNVEEVIFLAPDFGQNFWYKLATGTPVLRAIFKYFMKNGRILGNNVRIVGSLHLLPNSLLKLIRRTTHSQEARMRVFDTWCLLRKLKYKKTEISKLIAEEDTPFTFVLGKNDKIITPKSLLPICEKRSNIKYLELEASHPDLIDQYAKYLMGRN